MSKIYNSFETIGIDKEKIWNIKNDDLSASFF
jgi:hypothetical protein